jgi:hypothetical protein
MKRMIHENRKRRCRFPKWMDSTDVRTAIVFLFYGDLLEETLPAGTSVLTRCVGRSFSALRMAGE